MASSPTSAAPRSASGSRACTGASGCWPSPARPVGSSCTPATTPTVPFYGTSSAGTTHTMSDTDEFRYTTLGEGELNVPGSWTRPASCPRRARALVGLLPGRKTPTLRSRRSPSSAATVVEPAEDTPYGRLAVACRSDGCGVQAGRLTCPSPAARLFRPPPHRRPVPRTALAAMRARKVLDLLEQPAVAVGVFGSANVAVVAALGVEAGRLALGPQVERLAHVDAPADQVLLGSSRCRWTTRCRPG